MIPRTFSCVLILALASVPGFGQSSAKPAAQPRAAAVSAATAVPAIPKDPKDLMLLAAKVNGLASMGPQPWYVMADFQTFDPDGKPKDKGTFEEWWAGPEKYKISYQSSGFNQVLYHVGGRSMVTGDTGLAPLPELMAKEYLLSPLSVESEIAKKNFTDVDGHLGKVKLRCVRPVRPVQPYDHSLDAIGQSDDFYCLDPNVPAIRVESFGRRLSVPTFQIESFERGLSILFNKVVSAGGHYVAEQITARNSDLPIVEMKVTALEFPSHIENSVFAPPPSAVPSSVLWLESGITAGNRISGKEGHYPRIAMNQGIQGEVILSATINKVGEIKDLEVISGPEALRQASFDAVKTWKYKPFLLNGKPVDVETQINAIYTLIR